jgi:hypothetical protein
MGRLYLDGDLFERLCSERGWRHTTERCQKLNVGRTTLHRWYRGEPVGRRTADQVCEVLGVRFSALFTESVTVAAGGSR